MTCTAVVNDSSATHREEQVCHCIRPSGHTGMHTSERTNGSYFAWRYEHTLSGKELIWCNITAKDATLMESDLHFELAHPCDAED